VLPEVWNGHNVADFIDPEIMQRLEELEEEEEKLMGLSCYDNEKDEESEEELKGIKKLAKKYIYDS
jgi:nucleolar GTP-binding protein